LQHVQRRAQGDGHDRIRDIDAGAVAEEIEVGIAREEHGQLRPGELDGGLLIVCDRLVQASLGSFRFLNVRHRRRFDPNVGGAG
jgi:hypothetical protein